MLEKLFYNLRKFLIRQKELVVIKNMKEFDTIDKVNVPGRGLIYLVELGPNQKVAVGEDVLLDGEEKRIYGIERAMTLMDPPSLCRRIGLLARECKSA